MGSLPFSDTIPLLVEDSVTEFSLCFSSTYTIPVSITSSECFSFTCYAHVCFQDSNHERVVKVGASIGAVAGFLGALTIISLALLIAHFHNKV